MKNNIGLNEAYTGKMVEQLNGYLSNVQVAYMNVRGYHWNIVGKQFFSLHAKFEEVYDNLNELADEVAERILMLGGKPVHSFSEYLKIATLKEKVNVSSADETVRSLMDDITTLLEDERKILAIAGDNDDEGTANLVSDMISQQEKLLWMFSALLK
jgi:starvation-inducible DNA-binding protein